jgi:lipopolysaccharide transport system permease protein
MAEQTTSGERAGGAVGGEGLDAHPGNGDLPARYPGRRPAPLVIKPSSGWVSLGLRELWAYRELFYILVWRDVKVRYKQTAVGVIWTVLQPLAMMALFTLVFGHLLDVPSEGVPYPLFIFAALVPWQVFAQALGTSAGSLVNNRDLIAKIYFPRLLVPAAPVVAAAIDLLLGLVVLAAFMAFYGVVPSLAVLALPALVLFAVLVALAAGMILSALNVRYRDVQYAIPFLTQFLFFATPIVYTVEIFPQPWRTLLGLNPVAGVVEGFRWALFDPVGGFEPLIGVSVGVTALLLVAGLAYFRRAERTFADEV